MIDEISRYEALLSCRDAAGSDSQLARDLGVPQPKVWRWINQSKQLPAEYVLRAEGLYNVSRHLLRPDIYPANLPPAPRWYGVDRAANRVTFNGRVGTKRAAPRGAAANRSAAL